NNRIRDGSRGTNHESKGASMTKTQNWVFAGVSAFALITGILLATGAVTFAQTGEPTPTPSASGGSSGGSSPTPNASPGNEQTRVRGFFPQVRVADGT